MNKLTKLLSVFVIAGVIGTGVAGVAGCKKKNKNPEHSYTYTQNEDGKTHNGKCSVDGCEEHAPVTNEACFDGDDEDELCDKCGGVISKDGDVTVTGVTITSANEVEVGKTLKLTAQLAPAGATGTVVWSIVEGGTLATLAGDVLTAGNTEGTVKVKATCGGASGEATITIKAAGTVTPEPTGKYAELLEANKDNGKIRYNNDFGTVATVPAWGGDYTVAGIGQSTNGGDATNVVEITADGKAELKDGSGKATRFHVGFGAIKGAVEGYFEMTFISGGSSWTPVQMFDSNGGEVFRIRWDGTALKVAVPGPLDANNKVTYDYSAIAVAAVTPTATSEYKVYFTVSADNKLTIKLLGETDIDYLTDYQLTSGINGIMFGTSDSNAKRMSVDNVIIVAEQIGLADYKANKVTELNTAYTAYDDTLYSETWYGKITEAKDAGVTAIDGAETIEAVKAAYDTAIAAMKAVPTIEGEALYNAKVEFKAWLEDNIPASIYTYNAEAYAAVHAKMMKAVEDYSGEIGAWEEKDNPESWTGLYKAGYDASADLANIKDDFDVLNDAREAAKTALDEVDGGAEAFTINAEEYNTAINTHKDNINAIELPETGVTKEIVEAKLAEVAAAKTAGETAIKAIDNDTEELAAAKEAAITEITNYKVAEVNALAPKDGITQEQIDEVKENIAGVRERRIGAVEAITIPANIANVQKEVDDAKENIDTYLSSLTENLETLQTNALNNLRTAVDNAKAKFADAEATEKAEIDKILEKIYTANAALINAVTKEENKGEVATLYNNAVIEVNVAVEKKEAYKAIVAKATELKNDLQNTQAQKDIDDEILYKIAETPNKDHWSDDMWVIHNATTVEGVREKRDVVLAAIKKISDDAKAASYTVTLKGTNETMSVQYGTEVKLGDIYVTAKKVISASYSSKPITADSGVIVYNPVEIDVVTQDIEGYEASVEWRAPEEAGNAEATIADNCLFKVENILSGATYVVNSKTVEDVAFKGAWKSANIATDATAGEALTVTVKEKLASMTLYVALGDNSMSGRIGVLTVSVKDSDGTVKKTVSTEKPSSKTFITHKEELTNLNLGDTITVTISEITEGSRLYLFGIDAAIDETKVAEEVSIKWGADAAVAEKYHYYDAITHADGVDPDGKVFLGWYYTPEGGEETKFENGTKFHSGTDIVMTPKFLAANVTVQYKLDGENIEADTAEEFALPAAGEIVIKHADATKAGNYFLGWQEEGASGLFDFKNVAPNEDLSLMKTITLVPVFAAHESYTGEVSVPSGSTLSFLKSGTSDVTMSSSNWTSTFGSSSIGFGATNSKITWKKQSDPNGTSGYLNLNVKANNDLGTYLTVTTTTLNAVFKITFQGINTKRYFIIKDSNDAVVGDGAATTAGLPAGAYEQKNADKNNSIEIILAKADTYKIYFCTSETSAKDHKINAISVAETKTETLTKVVQSISATGTADNLVVKAKLEGDLEVTLTAEQYTVVDGLIIYGASKTAADAHKFNSCAVPTETPAE